jgi:hypothetical protein
MQSEPLKPFIHLFLIFPHFSYILFEKFQLFLNIFCWHDDFFFEWFQWVFIQVWLLLILLFVYWPLLRFARKIFTTFLFKTSNLWRFWSISSLAFRKPPVNLNQIREKNWIVDFVKCFEFFWQKLRILIPDNVNTT